MGTHTVGTHPADMRQLQGRLDVAYRRIDQVTAQLAAVTVERDAYGDTLTNIRDRADDTAGVSPAVIAGQVLNQHGYLPYGRLRQAEAALADALAEIRRLTALLATSQ